SVETLLMKVYDKYHKQIRERKKKHLADLSLIIASLLYDMPIASTDNVFKGNGIEEIIYRYATQIGLNDDEKKEEFKNYILKITKRK
ncbi:MAG: hypothetical protein QXP04_01375, partial [Candidatus Nanoarchaeia archaeon]|nr:hypothetical protein [Candidatus Jingweiarchaeum tengchongense]